MSTGKTIALIKGLGGGTGSGGGASLPPAAPYQQLVTDGAGNWVPEDRLAWKETKNETLVDNVAVEVPTANQPVNNPFTIREFVVGRTYTITWDGQKYECVAYEENGATVVGNATIAGMSGGNSEPFFIADFNGNAMLGSSETGTHTISITGVVEDIHPIPDEYMPRPKTFYANLNDSKPVLYKDKECTVGTTINDFYDVLHGCIESAEEDGTYFKITQALDCTKDYGSGFDATYIGYGDNSEPVFKRVYSSDYSSGK